MLDKQQSKALADKVLGFSSFPNCSVTVESSETAFIRLAANGITTSGDIEKVSISIESNRDGRVGRTLVAQTDDASLRAAVQLTERLALISPPDLELAPPLGPQTYRGSAQFDAATASARNDVMIPQLRAVVTAAKAKGLVAAAFFERVASSTAIANKHGNFGFGRTANAWLSITMRNAEGTSSGWASQPAANISAIDGSALAAAAIEKCLRWKNPRRLEPGKYTVILEPTAAGDLLPTLRRPLNARNADEGTSAFAKRGGGNLRGEKLFPEFINLRTDPFQPLYSCLPWDTGDTLFGSTKDTGLAAAPVPWIQNGVLKTMFYDRYWALKTGNQPTPYPNDFVLEGTEKSLADLIAGVDRALLVTRFWYVRPVNRRTSEFTGLTRDGLFLVENGKITAPVVNFRFNQRVPQVLENAQALGRSVRVRGAEGSGMIAPPMVVRDFNFSSVSDAV